MFHTPRDAQKFSLLIALGLLLLALGFYLNPKFAPKESADVATPEPAWIEMGTDQAVVRVLIRSASCPTLTVDGALVATKARASSTTEFPGLVCELAVPTSTQQVQWHAHDLARLSLEPKRIVILGDTGCRISGHKVQACNDPAQWPFAQVARAAAAWHPDLVIHVGDYHYRESPCPPGNRGCAGATVGDNWSSWMEDFFIPAAPLLQAAPWVFVRGNHELCARGGKS